MYKHYILTVLALCIVTSVYAQPYPIGTSSFSFADPNRGGRLVTGEIYYPATSTGNNTPVAIGEFPLVVFGHGFIIPISEYSVWRDNLVPEGYILVLPDTEGGIPPSHGDFGEDLSFLVDTYLTENTTGSSTFFQKLNGKTAVMGHSMGGGASFLAAASNSNVTAHVSLAAAETNPSAIAAAASITIPSLVLAGGDDCVAPPVGNQLDMYNALVSSYKAYAEITGGSHCQFGDDTPFAGCDIGEFGCQGSISAANQHTYMLNLTLPWFDHWLKCECEAWTTFHNYLTTATTHTYMEAGTQPTLYPSGVSSSGVTASAATLSWNAVAGTSEYYICYRPQGTSTWMMTSSTMTNTALTGLTGSTTYEYIVSADCMGCDDPNAPIQTFVTSGGGTPCYSMLTTSTALAPSESGVADYESSDWIASNATILGTAQVDYDAANYIELLANFEVRLGAVFCAFIDGCNNGGGGVNLKEDNPNALKKSIIKINEEREKVIQNNK